MKPTSTYQRNFSPIASAIQLGSELLFTEGGMTLFFILPAVIALFLIEAMPQF